MSDDQEAAAVHAYNQASGYYLPDPEAVQCPACRSHHVPAGWRSPAEVKRLVADAEHRGVVIRSAKATWNDDVRTCVGCDKSGTEIHSTCAHKLDDGGYWEHRRHWACAEHIRFPSDGITCDLGTPDYVFPYFPQWLSEWLRLRYVVMDNDITCRRCGVAPVFDMEKHAYKAHGDDPLPTAYQAVPGSTNEQGCI